MQNQANVPANNQEINLKALFLKGKEAIMYLFSKWLIILIIGIIGGALGIWWATLKKPVYTATLSFAMEDDKSSSGGLSGALGLASTFGIDLGTGGGGAFTGPNLIELMKSRKLVEQALLSPITVNGKEESLAQYYLNVMEFNKGWEKDPNLAKVYFPVNPDRSKFTLQQDSVLGLMYNAIVSPQGEILAVAQKDKKVSILTVEVKTPNELFSKVFAERIAVVVSDFYIATKSKKARTNVAILQRQADSIRASLDNAISGVAVANDNIFNLNAALNAKRVPSSKRQIDVQANTAILTQLVTNLELAKVTLMKETPLIQIIDTPILPLKKEKRSKLKGLIAGGILAGLAACLFLLGRRFFRLQK